MFQEPFSLAKLLLLYPFILILLVILYLVASPYFKLIPYKMKGLDTYFFPIIGFLRYWSLGFASHGDYFAKFKNASKEYPSQKALVTHLATNTIILLRDAQYLKEFFQKHHLYRKVGIIEFMKPLIGDGLIFVEGDTWKQHRKIISNSFHYESLKANIPLVQKTTRQFLDRITPEQYQNFPIINKIQEITGEIVGLIFFGESLNSYKFEGNNITHALANLNVDCVQNSLKPTSLLLGINLVNIIPSHRKLMKRVKAFRQVIYQIILDRKASGQVEDDLLGALLSSQKSSDPADRLSDENIIDEFITFFGAGMDTTGHLVGMALYNLTQYPEYFQILKDEREATYNKEKITNLDTLQKMNELHCLLKETLRFYTPAPLIFDREALVDHKILDLHIPKGAWVKPDFYPLFFNQKHFDQPEKFDPQIWKNNTTIDPYAFTPFSAGTRNCIGQHLAMAEAKVIVSEFLERFDFKLKDGYKLKMVFRFLNEPYDELLLDLSPKIAQN